MAFYAIFDNLRSGGSQESNERIDGDEQTVVASENRSFPRRETREICIKWVFPSVGDKRKVLQSHYTMLSMMLKAHPDLIVIDNKAQEHTNKKSMKPTESNRPFAFYTDHRNRRNRSLVCIHRIRTNQPLAALKDSWGVLEELKKQKAYVRTHAFGEKDREISHIGFIPGVNMVHIPKEVIKDEILTMLKQENAEVPNFEIVQVGVEMGKHSKMTDRTRAYEIQCLQQNASTLAKMLQSGPFKEKPVYVPYHMKQTKPAIFKGAIKRQLKVLSEQWVIKVQGFTDDMMGSIRDKLLESWIEAVVPTSQASRGEWKLLVHRNCYTKTMKWLREHWIDILELIPDEVSKDSPFDYQKIASRNGTTMDTSSEDGTIDTYGTILSSLYYEEGEEEDVQSEAFDREASPQKNNQDRPVSYAQVTRCTTSTVSQVTGWTDTKQEELNTLQEKHSNLEEKFNIVTAELGELKTLLYQILAQRTPPEDHEPPNKKQATAETTHRTERGKQSVEYHRNTGHRSTARDLDTGEDQYMQE